MVGTKTDDGGWNMTFAINNGVYWVGVQDPGLRHFDIVMETEHGTTYNSYLVRGEQGAALIDTVKAPFFEEYLARIQEVISLHEIKYLVVNHTEPDHAGSVENLVQLIPDLKIVASDTSLEFLREICRIPFHFEPIVRGFKIDLQGKTLQFASALMLHWPDNLYTYLVEDQILFSGDSFGSHYCHPGMYDDTAGPDMLQAFKYYYDGIMAPFHNYVLKAARRLERYDIQMICPGHGPILRTDPRQYIEQYRLWAEAASDIGGRPKIVVAYASAYGYTKTLADCIREGLCTVGDFDIKTFDLVDDPVSSVLQELEDARGLLIGSPTLNKDAVLPVWQFLAHLSPVEHGRLQAAAFGSYGWSGEAVPNIEARLRMLRMNILPGLRVRLKPSPDDQEKAREFGRAFAMGIMGEEAELETGLAYHAEINFHRNHPCRLEEYPRTYTNDDIIVYWNPHLCTHDTNCFDSLGAVFNPATRPWIDVNGASAEDIIRIIDRCPSRALRYAIPPGSSVPRDKADGPGSITACRSQTDDQ